jgi:hypothetical protein
MRTSENNTRQHAIVLIGTVNRYTIYPDQVTEFLNQCRHELDIKDLEDLDFALDDILELTIDGAEDNQSVTEFKKSLQLIRLIRLLFKGMLWEERTEN